MKLFTIAMTGLMLIGMTSFAVANPAMTEQANEQSAQLSMAPVSSSVPALQSGGLGEIASGAVEDTLKVCLTRVPDGASVGQRLMAESSCKRDKADRTSIDAVPGV